MKWIASTCIVLSLAAAQASPPDVQHSHGGGQQQNRPQTQPPSASEPSRQQPPSARSAPNPDKAKGSPGQNSTKPTNYAWPTWENIKGWVNWKSGLGWAEVAAVGALAVAVAGVVVSFLTIIVTALFLRYTYLMWKEMVRQNNNADADREESKRTTQESLKLTREGQATTQQAVQIAEDQLSAIMKATRARLAIDGIANLPAMLLRGQNSIKVEIVNRGHTPAIEVLSRCQWAITPNGRPVNWEALPQLVEQLTRIDIIGAGRPGRVTIELPEINAEDEDALIGGSKELLIHGTLDYDDVFQEQGFLQYHAIWNPIYESWDVSQQEY